MLLAGTFWKFCSKLPSYVCIATCLHSEITESLRLPHVGTRWFGNFTCQVSLWLVIFGFFSILLEYFSNPWYRHTRLKVFHTQWYSIKPEIKTLLHFWLKLSETSKVVSLTAVAPKKTPNCAKNILENQTLGTWAEVSQPKVTLPGINPVLAVDRGLKASVCGAFPACCSSRAGFGGSKCRASNKVRIPSVSLNFSGKPVVICCYLFYSCTQK